MNDERFAQCMKSIAEGDKTALKDIYEEYLPYLYSVVYGVVQQREAAEDVTSEVFLRIWKTAGKYRPGNGHKGYLATIARNMAIDELRKHKHEVLPDDEEEDLFSSTASDEQGPEEQIVGELSVQEALDRLKPAEREVVSMKVLSEMTFQEIADTLQIPLGTVTWRYQAAMKKLRSCGYE